jgi:hypothetical protein
LPGRAGGGGITIGPLPTTLALAGSGMALDCAPAAPGLGAGSCASASAQLPINKAAESLSSFIVILASR